MADEAKDGDDEKPKSGLVKLLIATTVVGLVCGGAGFGFATFLSSGDKTSEAAEVVPPAFLDFGEVVGNIGEGRMNRYLRIKIALQVDGENEESATAAIEENKAILRNWVLGYIADLQLSDIAGRNGQNRFRREAQNYFNDKLSPSGHDLITDLLFEEFTIQ